MSVVRGNQKWLRATLEVLGVLMLLAVAALALGGRVLEAPLLRALEARSGREIRVDGAFQAHLLSLHPTIEATQVSIGNPRWMPPGMTARIGRLSLALEWHPAVHLLTLRGIEMDDATLHLQRDASARTNWQLNAGGGLLGSRGQGPPLIKSLSVPHAQLELHDDRRHLDFTGTVSALDLGGRTGPAALRIEAHGQLNGRPASLVIDADPLAAARRDRPYHFRLDERSTTAHLSGQGSLAHPFDFRMLEGTFEASGQDLKDAYYLVGLRMPNTGPFRVSGRLERNGRRFVYSKLALSSGQSDLGGTVTVDSTRARPRLEGELSSESLHLSDLGTRAAGLAPAATQGSSLRLPDTPFRLTALRRVDTEIRLRANTVVIGPASLRSVSAVLKIDHGTLAIDDFKASLAGGSVAGSARFDGATDVPRAALKLSAADLRIDQLRARRGGTPPLDGLLSAQVQLSGAGQSFHDLASAASGTITAVIPHGSVRATLVDAASLNVFGELGAILKPDKVLGVRCAVASLDAHDGVLSIGTLVIDTDQALISATGNIHLDSEMLDLTLHGRREHARLSLPGALSIRGTLRQPKIKHIGRDALAAALNTVLAPISAVLTSIDPKLLQNADCAALIAQAEPAR